jgi:hypothetical protein
MRTSNPLALTVFLSFVFGMISAAFAADDGMPPKVTPVSKLPVTRELPDPFKMANGQRIKNRDEWPRRRAEILKQALEFEYGRIPSERTEVKATEGDASKETTSGASVHQIMLTMGPQGKVSTHLILTTPAGNGPFPTIIKGDLCWGRVKPEIVSAVIGRGYALAEFDRTEIAADKNDRGTGVFPLYPDYDWGVLAAWAWGYGRVVDYLETRPEIDKAKLIATGHSRGGKATLLAGALDERIALTAPNGSGCGGAGLFRVQWPSSENLNNIVKAFPYWFSPQFDEFIGHENQLPFDQHEVRALIAPRALFTTDSLDDFWANPLGTQVSYLASREVFAFLGAGEKIGLHYRHGPHDQNAEDFSALLDFADWQLLGKPPGRKFDALPFPSYPAAYKWAAPK